MSPKLLNILLILVPVVLYLGYLSPMYEGSQGLVWTPESHIGVLKSQNVQYKNALNQVALIQTEIGKIDKDYKSLSKELIASTTILLPDAIDQIKLREDVTAIANKTGVAITAFNILPYTKLETPGLSSYLVTFSIVSRYSVFKELMGAYEKSMRLFVIDSVQISHPQKREEARQDLIVSDSEALNIQVSFRVSYLK